MAASRFDAQMYTAEAYVESAGTVLFRLSAREICLLCLPRRDEYVLPKGRRKVGESRDAAPTRQPT
ncbi:hypothetical protein J3459_012142 [Metarhizium acridum]|uniref:uncharacterized protein n=1 Tax=Metarhizium acridum TaxID=92637 RepID=UPI001C6CD022|nr:hypothetical protein J3459_012142 [Metarhizium acridum]KAG8425668.1 hypothetical protein J3458_002348 [Metarhizium acridum]